MLPLRLRPRYWGSSAYWRSFGVFPYPQCEQNFFLMWYEWWPHRLHGMWVMPLFLRPNDVVPFMKFTSEMEKR